MDAGKRSKHTNAYFTGIGRTKRIVLFDTLLASHPEEEIIAVLAHEAGHWKKKHILKQLVVLEMLSLMGLYVVARLLNWPFMYQTFGFGELHSWVPSAISFVPWDRLFPGGLNARRMVWPLP
jgi:STE24 endopeptidase